MRKTIALAALAALTACGGGGGSSPSSPSVPSSAPTSAPQLPTANLVISFPVGSKTSANGKSPQFISPNTTQMEVVINTIDGVAAPGGAPFDTTTALTVGTNCTLSGGTETCTLPIVAPPGSIQYTFNAKDVSNNVLATLTTTLTIVKATNNLPSVTLRGVVVSVTVAGATLAANTAIAGGETLTVGATDASGATIVNGTTPATYAHPIKLTDNDPTGSTQLTVNGGTASSTVNVSGPADVVKLTYTGQAANGFTITAAKAAVGDPTITGGGTISTTVNDITFSGTTLDDAAHGGLSTDANFNAQTVFFFAAGGSQTVTPAELGYSNAPYSKSFVIDPGNGSGGTCGSASTIATATPASPTTATTFTITAGGSVGVCSMRIKEAGTGYPITQHPAPVAGNATQDGTFFISVTATDVGVNSKHRHN